MDFPNTYPLDSDLSGGERYPTLKNRGLMYIKVNMLIRINPVLVLVIKYGDGRRENEFSTLPPSYWQTRFGKNGKIRCTGAL